MRQCSICESIDMKDSADMVRLTAGAYPLAMPSACPLRSSGRRHKSWGRGEAWPYRNQG